MGFAKDKNRGNKAETLVVKFLEKFGKVEKNEAKKCLELEKWDIKLNLNNKDIFIEVKSDEMASKTGNLAIEYFNPKSNKPSGIFVTTSDYWIYVLDRISIWLTSVTKLKQFMELKIPKRIIECGGDKNASLYLYDKESILNNVFVRIDNLTEAEIIKLLK